MCEVDLSSVSSLLLFQLLNVGIFLVQELEGLSLERLQLLEVTEDLLEGVHGLLYFALELGVVCKLHCLLVFQLLRDNGHD